GSRRPGESKYARPIAQLISEFMACHFLDRKVSEEISSVKHKGEGGCLENFSHSTTFRGGMWNFRLARVTASTTGRCIGGLDVNTLSKWAIWRALKTGGSP